MSAHPTHDQLAAFARGELSDRAAGELAWHLDDCPRCAGMIRHLDPLHRALSSVPDPTVPDALLAALLDEARAPGSAPASSSSSIGSSARSTLASGRDRLAGQAGSITAGVALWAVAAALTGVGGLAGADPGAGIADILRVLRGLAIAAAHVLDADAVRALGLATLAAAVALAWMVRPRGGSRPAGGGWG